MDVSCAIEIQFGSTGIKSVLLKDRHNSLPTPDTWHKLALHTLAHHPLIGQFILAMCIIGMDWENRICCFCICATAPGYVSSLSVHTALNLKNKIYSLSYLFAPATFQPFCQLVCDFEQQAIYWRTWQFDQHLWKEMDRHLGSTLVLG